MGLVFSRYEIFPLVLVRHVTETDKHNTTQHKKHNAQTVETDNNQNFETLGLLILLGAENLDHSHQK